MNLDLQLLVQSYIQRWEIECNHRDERSLLGVAQGQVRSPQAVSRLPQFQVAAYSLLLLASLLCSGFQRTTDYLPLPKWRRQAARPSLLDLLNLLHNQIFARGVDTPTVNFDDFASASTPPAVKPSKLPLAAETLATLAADSLRVSTSIRRSAPRASARQWRNHKVHNAQSNLVGAA